PHHLGVLPPGAQVASMPSRRAPLGTPGWLRSNRLLQGTVAACALLVAYQLAVTLLQPRWGGVVTNVLRTVLAWLALLVVGYVAWWSCRAQRLESSALWWLVTAALLMYAIACTLLLVEGVFIHPHGVPFPTLSDFFLALQYPCFFLAIILLPRRRATTPRVILI